MALPICMEVQNLVGMHVRPICAMKSGRLIAASIFPKCQCRRFFVRGVTIPSSPNGVKRIATKESYQAIERAHITLHSEQGGSVEATISRDATQRIRRLECFE